MGTPDDKPNSHLLVFAIGAGLTRQMCVVFGQALATQLIGACGGRCTEDVLTAAVCHLDTLDPYLREVDEDDDAGSDESGRG